MKKTKAQKEYQRQMKALQQEGRSEANSKTRKSFKETKLYYYGSKILLIMVVMWLISIFDGAFFTVVNLFR